MRSCGMHAWELILLTAMLSMLSTSEASKKPLVKIGVVSSPAQAHNLAAAVEAALIAGDMRPDVRLATVEPDEPLDMPSQVCAKAAEGVSAIVAYGEAEDIRLSAAAAARVGVPLLLVSPTPKNMNLSHWEAIHMYPPDDVFIEACAALCDEKGWQSAVLLFDGAVGARLVQGTVDARTETAILARKLPSADDEEALRNLLLVLKKAEHTQFIVWCDEDCIERVLATAQRVGLLSERHAYILLALDLHTIDLEPYSHGGANITGLQFFDPSEEEQMLNSWRITYLRRLRAAVETGEDDSETSVDFEVAEKEADAVVAAPLTALILTFDVVLTACKMLGRLTRIAQSDLDSTSCEPLHSYGYADTLINYLRSKDSVDWLGQAGTRRAGRFHVVELARKGALLPVGIWDRRYGVLWHRPPVIVPPPPPGDMANQTFVVLIMLSKPYVMIKEASERLSGNERYEGFCIELIDKLSDILKFNYTLVEVPGDSNDAMLELINKTSDVHFAITDLTITAKREKSVDFTTPFMNLGISILYRKPTAPEPKLFAFMLPFSTGVWVCLGVAYVGTSLVLYVVGRLCPEEWQNPYPCIEEPEALENQFTLANALWFTLGAILCQGSEIAPVAYGSRAAASAWWIFALVITSSYTANLATLLAKKSNNQDFTNVEELANNTIGIKYGAKLNGSTYTFLKDSQEGLFKRMFEAMQEWDMPLNNVDAIKRVNNMYNEYEPFAYLMESTSIEYETERNCNLTQVGGLLDSKGYGIAMSKNSSYRQALNLALLNLQEAGELRVMKHRWWKEMHGGGGCDAEEQPENEELTMKNFLGLFLVLFIGCALGIFISLADLMVAAWRRPRDPTASYWRRLCDELRFVFHFQLSEKPVHGPLIPPPSPKPESIASEHLEEEEQIDSRLRSASFQSSGVRSRRRSSMHNASLRLARHAKQRDRSTPTRLRVNEP